MTDSKMETVKKSNFAPAGFIESHNTPTFAASLVSRFVCDAGGTGSRQRYGGMAILCFR